MLWLFFTINLTKKKKDIMKTEVETLSRLECGIFQDTNNHIHVGFKARTRQEWQVFDTYFYNATPLRMSNKDITSSSLKLVEPTELETCFLSGVEEWAKSLLDGIKERLPQSQSTYTKTVRQLQTASFYITIQKDNSHFVLIDRVEFVKRHINSHDLKQLKLW